MKKVVIFILAFVLMFGLVNASSLGRFNQSVDVSLHQVCDNCTFVNVTSMKFPNGTLTNLNEQMTKVGEDYNFSFSATNTIGFYRYNTCGNPGGVLTCENIDFEIGKITEELTEGRAGLYIMLTIMIFILFLGLLFFNIIIPYRNEENIRGDVIRIVRAKYLKIALIPITHAVFNWFLNLLLSISNNLITGLNIYFGMIEFLFNLSMVLVYPLWIFCLVWFFFNWIRDFGWNKKIEMFGRAVR